MIWPAALTLDAGCGDDRVKLVSVQELLQRPDLIFLCSDTGYNRNLPA